MMETRRIMREKKCTTLTTESEAKAGRKEVLTDSKNQKDLKGHKRYGVVP